MLIVILVLTVFAAILAALGFFLRNRKAKDNYDVADKKGKKGGKDNKAFEVSKRYPGSMSFLT